MDREMMGAASAAMEGLKAIVPGFLAIGFLVFAYFAIVFDRRRDNSPSKDDTQVGLKLVLYGLVLAGVFMVAGSLDELLSYVLGGFKGGSGPIKQSLPGLIVGAGVVFAIMTMLLPRTNAKTATEPERMAIGFVGLFFGAFAITSAYGLLSGLFNSKPWSSTSGSLSGLIVSGGLAFVAINRLGSLSSWTQPVRPAAPMPPAGYPPQQGGGYPPQGGGYPQQGGGYPPQGGGYPQQGGGYPPQGGGYPPQGGGGYPPR